MTTKSIVIAVVITVGVVAVPLYLKSTRAPSSAGGEAQDVAQAGQGLPRFVALGTTTCAPCKVMLNVMAELKQNYPGAFIIQFVNVKEHPEKAQRHGISIIPAQIFYGPDRRELYRHTGVFRTNEVIAKWAELGYRFTPVAER